MESHIAINSSKNSDQTAEGEEMEEKPISTSNNLMLQYPVAIPLPSIAAHSHLIPYSITSTFEIKPTPSDLTTSSQSSNALVTESSVIDDTPESILPLTPRHTRLQVSIDILEKQIAETRMTLSQALDALRGASTIRQAVGFDAQSDEIVLERAQSLVTDHIKLLHRYNEIKDVGLGLMGLIAEKEGKRLGEVMEERGVDDKD